MGKALYRKYRSKSLDDIIGQEHITDTLKNALKKGAISHAYLFTGPRGTGKTSIARILAHQINDIEYIDESTHLDIVEIDAASNRRIDEIRELRDKVHIAPTSAKYKVYIIDEVHMLTREAFNALLKTLEEPPAHVVFMLATTEAHKVPDTIMSRTQRYTLKPIAKDKVSKHLAAISKTENIAISNEALDLLAEHGRGSFRDSISMLDQLSGLHKDSFEAEDVQLLLGVPTKELIDSIIADVVQNDQKSLFDDVRILREQGIDANRAAQVVSLRLRQSLLEDKLLLEYKQTIRLLEKLLTLTGNSSDFIGLELALLSVMNIEATEPPNDKSIQKNKPPKTEKRLAEKETTIVENTDKNPPTSTDEVETSKNELPETKSSQDVEVKKVQSANTNAFSSETWNELLTDIKSKHNTLYGVLRMATPILKDDELTLVFNFGFHKKQLETPKNRPIVREYLEKYVGVTDFSAVVKKAANKAEDKPAEKHVDKPKDDAIDSVSNIFGSAELLES